MFKSQSKPLPKPVTQRQTTQLYAYKLAVIGTPIALVSVMVLFAITAAIVRDGSFPEGHPVKFSLETLMLSFIATIPFMYIIWSRTGSLGVSNLVDYIVLIIHFAGIHILFQYSGVYSLLFGRSFISSK